MELREQTPLPLQKQNAPVRSPASPDGEWSAKDLRSDVYNILVRELENAVFERTYVDLSAGGSVTLNLSINNIVADGRLTFTGRSLHADIRN